MDCSDVQNHCQPYLDGELDPKRCEGVREHLQVCRCCADQYQSQEQFHLLLRRSLMHRCSASISLRDNIATTLAISTFKGAGPEAFPANAKNPSASDTIPSAPSAPSNLQPRLNPFSPEPFTRRNAPARAGFSAAHFFGVAAMLMLMLGGYIVYTTQDGNSGSRGRSPVVIAAEKVHDRIVASVPSAPNLNEDPAALTEHVNAALKILPRFAGIPNLANCHLQAVNCGALECEGLPKGVFVKFVECKCDGAPVTLLVLESDKLPAGEEIHGFITDSSPGHSVISWRSCKDGLMYVLVTKMPMASALEVAEAARR